MSELEFKNEILEKYATEKGIEIRSTADLSVLEEWLLYQMYVESLK